jgi:hypothetical protein
LLNEINFLAENTGFLTYEIEAHEGKKLVELLAPFFRSALIKLSRYEAAKEMSRRGLRILKSFLGAVKINLNELDIGFSLESEVGTADSGDLEADLPEIFVAIGNVAKAAKRPIALFIDELQYLNTNEFSALIMAIHKVNQSNLPIFLVGAGLPQILGLAGNSKSYSERLFRYPEIGALEKKYAVEAIVNPAKDQLVSFTNEAVQELLDVTHQYPYFIQQWAYESWNVSEGPEISLADAQKATPKSIEELDRSFFKVRFDRCTPSEKKYMRALANFGDGNHRSGDVAELLGVKSQSVAPTRNNLIKKGMIFAPSHGDTAFTVPLFHEYMLRVMPEIP